MELGQRIKAARLEAGLSQRQLCGDMITRNMLSLIESARARPSMDTLIYFAGRLNKPVGYFLEEQAVTSPNQQAMASARNAFAQGAYREVLQALEGYRETDETFDRERWLLAALAALNLAEQALAQGKNAYALSLLETAEQAGGKTPYYTNGLERQRLLLAFRADKRQAESLTEKLPSLEGELLLRGQAALDGGDHVRCGEILDAAEDRSSRWYLLRGKAALGAGEFAGAAGFLHQAEGDFPRECYPMLEQCYRELEDYKRAYEYACRQK